MRTSKIQDLGQRPRAGSLARSVQRHPSDHQHDDQKFIECSFHPERLSIRYWTFISTTWPEHRSVVLDIDHPPSHCLCYTNYNMKPRHRRHIDQSIDAKQIDLAPE